jgi:hypothetical protein
MKACKIEGCPRTHFAKGYCGTHYRRVRVYGDPNTFQRIYPPGNERERFFARVVKGDSCWIWTGNLHRNGYGNAWNAREGRGQLAHRYAYEALVGPIPEGMQLDHTCHDRACVNPGHLRPVTNKQNNENPGALRSDNTSGYRGVRYQKRTGRFEARAQHHGIQHNAGTFATAEEAAEAARQLRLSLFTHNDLDRKAS